jgi:CheY-like chemotaxis protein
MRKRILVADDEPLTAELLALVLAFGGYEVVEAHDGREALERAREVRPDAVLLDFMMPQLTGAEVARTIREDPQLAETPVVLFSCVDESEVDWRGSGADLFLQKPMDMRRLPEMIDRLTGQEKRAA